MCEELCGFVAIAWRTRTQRTVRRSTSGRNVRATASTSGSSGMLEWNRFESSKWRQFQSVFAGFCFRRIAERRDNGLRFMPVGELVGVVAAADLAGFASGNE